MEIRDKIIESVVKKFINRSDVGYKKYGVTLHKDDQPLDTWLQHIQEELMDAVNYIEKTRHALKSEIEECYLRDLKEKGILDKGDAKTQLIKLYEETGELSQSLLNNDKEGVIDAIGDSVVVLTNLAELNGVSIETCMQSAYDEISGRTGRMVNGTFVKD